MSSSKKFEIVVIMGLSCFFGLVFWVVDSYFEFKYFHKNLSFLLLEGPESFLESLALKVPLHSLFVRLSFLAAALVGGGLTAMFVIKKAKSDEALRFSEEKFRNLFNNSEIAMFRTKLDGSEVLDVNQKFLDLVGKTRQETVGHTSMIHWKDPQECEKMIEKLIADGSVSEFEFRMMNSEKGIRDCLTSLRLYREQGILEGSIVDITERKQAEAEKTRLLSCQRAILDNLPMMAWLKDPESRLEMINEPYAKACGHRIEECLGKTDLDLFPEEMAKGFIADDREVCRSGLKKQVEEAISTPEGVQWHLTYKTPVFNEHGLVIGTTGIAQDITERKNAEEERARLQSQLIQAQKMESVGQLAGGVAHDFNNMLGVILGHAEMAMEHIDPNQPIFTDLAEIKKAAERSADITRQLLAFARKQTITPKVIDLNETISKLLKMLRRLIGEDINLAWLPGFGLWEIKADPVQIDQILTNICVNARGAIAGVGRITVETGNSVLADAYCALHKDCIAGEYVRITISDNGRGMDKLTLAHIFEPFFTTKGVGEGTGLGLSMVYGAVKQNNGFVDVVSEPGQGTTFTIYLPRHRSATLTGQTGQGVGEIPAVGGRERILLVEDEQAILKMTTAMLEMLGYNVVAAAGPQEALHLAGTCKGEIHLLLTDIVMPEMNGRELAKKLLSIYPQLKCLFMSGYTSDIIAQQGILDEGVHFIQKPFAKNDMAAKIRILLEKN